MRYGTTGMSVADRVATYGVSGLNNLELIKSILMLASKAEKANEKIARKVEPMVNNGETEISKYEDAGCKNNVATVLAGMAEYMKRAKGKNVVANNPMAIYERIKHYAYSDVEKFIVVYLDGASQIMEVKEIASGVVDRCITDQREVFAPALVGKYCRIALAHNHPSGQTEPSKEDIAITKKLREAGNILGITVIDHIIITQTEYYSFAEHGI